MSTQFATRVDDLQSTTFKETTRQLGTTPADALRIFIAAFNEHRGFPFDVRLSCPLSVEAFETEEDATAFSTSLALEMMHNER